MFLNGANIIGFQAVCATLMAVTALVLKIVFAQWFGVSGVIWAVVLSYTLLIAVPMLVYVPRLLGGMNASFSVPDATAVE